MEDVQNKLQNVRNPIAAMMVLLREMDLETDQELRVDGPGGAGRNVTGTLIS